MTASSFVASLVFALSFLSFLKRTFSVPARSSKNTSTALATTNGSSTNANGGGDGIATRWSPTAAVAAPRVTAVAYCHRSALERRRATPVEHPSLLGLMHRPSRASPPTDATSRAHHAPAGSPGSRPRRRTSSLALAPPAAAAADASASDISHAVTVTLRHVVTPSRRAAASAAPVALLSMHSRDAAAPLPVNATPFVSKNAWSVPSSPTPPCTERKTTAFSFLTSDANARREDARDSVDASSFSTSSSASNAS